jgi:uncharacterized membrane protein (DUF4010 family)
VDAITLSMAQYARGGDPQLAVRAIIIAALSNTAVKAGMVMVLGGRALRRPLLLSALAIIATGAIAMLILQPVLD